MHLMDLDPQLREYLAKMYRSGGDHSMARGIELAGLVGEGSRAFRAANNYAASGVHELAMKAADAVPLGKGGAAMSRFAAHPYMLKFLKFATPVAAAGGVLGAGDVVFGNDSAGNKLMDAAAMGAGAWGGIKGAAAGAAAGSVIPVVGTAGGAILGGLAGAGIGKTTSDTLQWLFGDKKTQEQRKLEEALALLQGGMI